MLDYTLQSFHFFPLPLHFKFPFLQLSSASCDQSLNTQERNYVPLYYQTRTTFTILTTTTKKHESHHSCRDLFSKLLATMWPLEPALLRVAHHPPAALAERRQLLEEPVGIFKRDT